MSPRCLKRIGNLITFIIFCWQRCFVLNYCKQLYRFRTISFFGIPLFCLNLGAVNRRTGKWKMQGWHEIWMKEKGVLCWWCYNDVMLHSSDVTIIMMLKLWPCYNIPLGDAIMLPREMPWGRYCCPFERLCWWYNCPIYCSGDATTAPWDY